jgi:hypothetical protein
MYHHVQHLTKSLNFADTVYVCITVLALNTDYFPKLYGSIGHYEGDTGCSLLGIFKLVDKTK